MGWSEAELETLASLAETFVRGGATRRAGLAAQAIDHLDPDQSRQLRLVLKAVQSRAANLALAGHPTSFRDMSPAARERYVLGWGTSRVAARRSAFQAYKRLMCFLAYADPGDGGRNPLWPLIGYNPTVEPVTDTPTAIVPFEIPTMALGAPAELDADVVVVGSGAGGGVVAAELARAGRSVVVLEAGPFVPETEMPTSELAAFDTMYLDHGLTASWDGAVSILAGSVVGGGTTINWTTSIAPPAHVRAEWAAEHGLEGIDGAEFDTDVTTIEGELHVQPPHHVPPKDALILRGAAELGWSAGPTVRNGMGCGDCGLCPFGCRMGAKQGGLRVHLADAWRHDARIVPGALVRRVTRAPDGRVTGVEADLGDGRRLAVHARQVVIAAGALRTPGILERSAITHPQVGRNLRLHPVSVVVALLRDRVDMWSGTSQAASSTEYLMPRSAGSGTFIIESAPGHPGLIAQALPWASTDEFAMDMARVGHAVPLIAIVRDLGSGRVGTSRSGRTRIDYRVKADDVRTLRHGLVAMARVARAAGALEIGALGMPAAWFGRGGFSPGGEEAAFETYVQALSTFDFSPNRGTVFSAHQMGSARMGGSASDHPVDPRGHVRTDARGSVAAGLYVADTSLFPTAIGVNPMITVMALARRVSRTVLAEA